MRILLFQVSRLHYIIPSLCTLLCVEKTKKDAYIIYDDISVHIGIRVSMFMFLGLDCSRKVNFEERFPVSAADQVVRALFPDLYFRQDRPMYLPSSLWAFFFIKKKKWCLDQIIRFDFRTYFLTWGTFFFFVG